MVETKSNHFHSGIICMTKFKEQLMLRKSQFCSTKAKSVRAVFLQKISSTRVSLFFIKTQQNKHPLFVKNNRLFEMLILKGFATQVAALETLQYPFDGTRIYPTVLGDARTASVAFVCLRFGRACACGLKILKIAMPTACLSLIRPPCYFRRCMQRPNCCHPVTVFAPVTIAGFDRLPFLPCISKHSLQAML